MLAEKLTRLRIRQLTTERRILIGIVLVFCVLTTISNLSVSLFEAPDEAGHYKYVYWLAAGNSLPDLVSDGGFIQNETWQTPLYYYLVAPLVQLAHGGLPADIAPFNLDYTSGFTHLFYFHTRAESFPYHDTSLAVHLLRLATSLFGLGVILITYSLAQSIYKPAALPAAAIVAFNPQFIFMSASISNDVPAACLAGLTMLWLCRGIRQTNRRPLWFVWLGVLGGLAVMTKLNNLVLVVPLVVGLVAMHWSPRRQLGSLLVHGLLTMVALFALAGWWFLLNWERYGDFLAWQPMLNLTAGLLRQQPLNWLATLQYSTGLLYSFWMPLHNTQFVPQFIYYFFGGFMLVALVGLGLWLWQYTRQKEIKTVGMLGLLILWVVLSYGTLLQWMRLVKETDQGRLLYPAISGLSIIVSVGLSQISWRRVSIAWPVVLGLLSIAVLTPLVVTIPAHSQPAFLSDGANLPNSANIQFGQDIVLRGYNLSPNRLNSPGQLNVDLYWQAQAQVDDNYIVRIVLANPNRTLSMIDSTPYNGRYPTPVWQPGQTFQDRYSLNVDARKVSGLARVYLSLYPIKRSNDPLPIHDNDVDLGTQLLLGVIKLRSAEPITYKPQIAADTFFSNTIQLTGFDAPTALSSLDSLTVTLYWQAANPTSVDYTAFVHLTGPDGEIVAQGDSPPQAGQYPTSYWDAAEQVQDVHIVPLPADLSAGQYRLTIGLYNAADGQRLPAMRSDGTRWPDDALQLKTYSIP
jgi:hypothetical protein